MRKRRRKNRAAVPAVCLLLLAALAVGVLVYVDGLAYKTYQAEAGEEVAPSDFLKTADADAFFTQDSEPFDIAKPGEYRIKVKSGLFTHSATLIIKDETPPRAQPVQVRLEIGDTCEAGAFVENVVDATEVTVAYVAEPDFTKIGSQPVQVRLTDRGNNVTVADSELVIAHKDKEAPVITGAEDLEIYEGDGVAYRKNVVVTDNYMEGLEWDVDTSQVDQDKAGVYPVTYTARDAAGNTTSVTVNLTVKARLYKRDQVEKLADEVLAEIITPNMTALEKVEAIYKYNMSHIGYIEHSEKGDWVRAAYEGIVQGRGDCYVYFSTAKVLLTRAGITNMDIVKIPSDSEHYWNLVDIGDGWYHFDTTPRKDGPRIFMWTEAQLMEYSAAHKNSHNYNHDNYPQVN